MFASLLCSEIGGIVLRERWEVKGLQSRAHPGNDAAPALPGLGVSTLPSEATALHAAVPTSLGLKIEEEAQSQTSWLPSCTGCRKKQPQTWTNKSHPA